MSGQNSIYGAFVKRCIHFRYVVASKDRRAYGGCYRSWTMLGLILSTAKALFKTGSELPIRLEQ